MENRNDNCGFILILSLYWLQYMYISMFFFFFLPGTILSALDGTNADDLKTSSRGHCGPYLFAFEIGVYSFQ